MSPTDDRVIQWLDEGIQRIGKPIAEAVQAGGDMIIAALDNLCNKVQGACVAGIDKAASKCSEVASACAAPIKEGFKAQFAAKSDPEPSMAKERTPEQDISNSVAKPHESPAISSQAKVAAAGANFSVAECSANDIGQLVPSAVSNGQYMQQQHAMGGRA